MTPVFYARLTIPYANSLALRRTVFYNKYQDTGAKRCF